MFISIYNKKSGQIIKNVSCPEDSINLQYDQNTEEYFIGNIDQSKFFVENKELVAIPIKQFEYQTFDWDLKQWTDNRTNEDKWNDVRSKRNMLLEQSDWTQLNDIDETIKNKWISYRKDLRDITKQLNPANVIWPTPPQG
jgi:hypothetical protein